MPQQSPLEKLADQVLIILSDYSSTDRNLTEENTRREIADRTIENGKTVKAFPARIASNVRMAIVEVLEVYKHKPKALREFGVIVSIKNEVMVAVRTTIEEKIPGGTTVRKPQQFRLFVGLREEADRLEARLNEWARGDVRDVAGVNDIPHIKRTQLAMASDPRDGEGTVVVGVLVSYEAP